MHFLKKKRDKEIDESEKKRVSKYENAYNDGGLQKFVKELLHYDEKNKILSDKDERNFEFAYNKIFDMIFNFIREIIFNIEVDRTIRIRSGNSDYGKDIIIKGRMKMKDFPQESNEIPGGNDGNYLKDYKNATTQIILESYFWGDYVPNSNTRGEYIDPFNKTKKYKNILQYILLTLKFLLKESSYVSKDVLEIKNKNVDLDYCFASYLGCKFSHYKIDEKSEYERDNFLDNELVNLNKKFNINRTQFGRIVSREDIRISKILGKSETTNRINENTENLKNIKNIIYRFGYFFTSIFKEVNSNIIPLFCNMYLKGGTAFRLLFKKELEKENTSEKKIKVHRLKEWKYDVDQKMSKKEIEEKEREVEFKLNEKLGEPSDYDLNCCINPWIEEKNFNVIKNTLNLIIMNYMIFELYPKIANRYNIDANNQYSKKINKLLKCNPYKKPLFIIPDIKNNTKTSIRKKIEGEKVTIFRENKKNYEEKIINNTELIQENKYKHESLPYFIEDITANVNQQYNFLRSQEGNNEIIDRSFSFYSRGHMLWTSDKLLKEEATEFELHRLMLQIPIKEIYINVKEEKAEKIKDEVLELNNIENFRDCTYDNNDNIDYTLEQGVQVKKVPTKTDIAIELIDISVIDWGGAEKITKWYDTNSLKSDRLFSINDIVYFYYDGTYYKSKIINIYSIKGYYDIMTVDDRVINGLTIYRVPSKDNKTYEEYYIVYDEEERKEDNWSYNLQLYPFENSIHDLTLVIDDNKRDGRIRKLAKRERRRAFLLQLLYIFVKEPDEKSFKDPDNGPINVLLFEGYENYYSLFEKKKISMKLVEDIFKTQIDFCCISKDEKVELYQGVNAREILSVNIWERLEVILLATLQIGINILVPLLNDGNINITKVKEQEDDGTIVLLYYLLKKLQKNIQLLFNIDKWKIFHIDSNIDRSDFNTSYDWGKDADENRKIEIV